MEKAFTVQLTAYAPLLKSARISFREDDKSLTSGRLDPGAGYVLFLSCKTRETPVMLETVLPLLSGRAIPFRLIKNQLLQYRLNSGAFGDEEAGKVLALFPQTLAVAVALAAELCQLTGTFKGPVVQHARRLGEVVYVQQAEVTPESQLRLFCPDGRDLPFPVPAQYRPKKRRTGLLSKYYLPVQLLRSSAKGNIYKAINMRRFAFTWCLVKQGNPVALDDHFDRDMKDRLRWQHAVLEDVAPQVNTPGVLRYFEQDGSSYLVMEYAEGPTLYQVVKRHLNGKQWKEVDKAVQYQLLSLYLQAVTLVGQVHEAGYVHRDITDSNFLVPADGKLCIIDFELSYSLRLRQPNPPFLLGTFGYAAPEQLEHALPDEKEDVYSLGALLCFVLTGCPPHELISPDHRLLKSKLSRLTGCVPLVDLAIRCLQAQRRLRPDMDILKDEITLQLSTLKLNAHEKITMAG